jgi:hypothetical protein
VLWRSRLSFPAWLVNRGFHGNANWFTPRFLEQIRILARFSLGIGTNNPRPGTVLLYIANQSHHWTAMITLKSSPPVTRY